jgi:hypothetical protein
MVECPRCGNQAQYLPGEGFALVWCGFCLDLIEVGELDLHPDTQIPELVAREHPVSV